MQWRRCSDSSRCTEDRKCLSFTSVWTSCTYAHSVHWCIMTYKANCYAVILTGNYISRYHSKPHQNILVECLVESNTFPSHTAHNKINIACIRFWETPIHVFRPCLSFPHIYPDVPARLPKLLPLQPIIPVSGIPIASETFACAGSCSRAKDHPPSSQGSQLPSATFHPLSRHHTTAPLQPSHRS